MIRGIINTTILIFPSSLWSEINAFIYNYVIILKGLIVFRTVVDSARDVQKVTPSHKIMI